jgi:hypothetical protein
MRASSFMDQRMSPVRQISCKEGENLSRRYRVCILFPRSNRTIPPDPLQRMPFRASCRLAIGCIGRQRHPPQSGYRTCPYSVSGCDCQALPPSTNMIDHHGQASLSKFAYLHEHVATGPVNHVDSWRATAEKLCPTMGLQLSHQAPILGSRKEVAGWEWFTEPPNNKLYGHTRVSTFECGR